MVFYLIIMSHSKLWGYIVLQKVDVYSYKRGVIHVIDISRTRIFQKSIGISVRPFVTLLNTPTPLYYQQWHNNSYVKRKGLTSSTRIRGDLRKKYMHTQLVTQTHTCVLACTNTHTPPGVLAYTHAHTHKHVCECMLVSLTLMRWEHACLVQGNCQIYIWVLYINIYTAI